VPIPVTANTSIPSALPGLPADDSILEAQSATVHPLRHAALNPSIHLTSHRPPLRIADYIPNQTWLNPNSLCTCCTTSSLIGAVKTAGRGREPELSPVADQTETVGRAAILEMIDQEKA
jgi:hypothetical protein